MPDVIDGFSGLLGRVDSRRTDRTLRRLGKSLDAVRRDLDAIRGDVVRGVRRRDAKRVAGAFSGGLPGTRRRSPHPALFSAPLLAVIGMVAAGVLLLRDSRRRADVGTQLDDMAMPPVEPTPEPTTLER